MIAACLILVMADKTLLPVAAPFPTETACNVGGLGMTDGRTVRNFMCVPQTIYDCRGTKDRPRLKE